MTAAKPVASGRPRWATVGRGPLVVLSLLAAGVLAGRALLAPGVAVSAEGPPAAAERAPLPVTRTVSGTLARDGDDFVVGDVVVEFGPRWHVARSRAEVDFDGDGRVERLAAELDGLVRSEVTLEVDADGGPDADVRTIDGKLYRATQGPPPWAGGPRRNAQARQGADDRHRDRGRPWSRPGPPPWAGGPPAWAPGPPPWAGGGRS